MMNQRNPATYQVVTVQCQCGNYFNTRSTYRQPVLPVEICAHCHPAYTGETRRVVSDNQINKYHRRYG